MTDREVLLVDFTWGGDELDVDVVGTWVAGATALGFEVVSPFKGDLDVDVFVDGVLVVDLRVALSVTESVRFAEEERVVVGRTALKLLATA